MGCVPSAQMILRTQVLTQSPAPGQRGDQKTAHVMHVPCTREIQLEPGKLQYGRTGNGEAGGSGVSCRNPLSQEGPRIILGEKVVCQPLEWTREHEALWFPKSLLMLPLPITGLAHMWWHEGLALSDYQIITVSALAHVVCTLLPEGRPPCHSQTRTLSLGEVSGPR